MIKALYDIADACEIALSGLTFENIFAQFELSKLHAKLLNCQYELNGLLKNGFRLSSVEQVKLEIQEVFRCLLAIKSML